MASLLHKHCPTPCDEKSSFAPNGQRTPVPTRKIKTSRRCGLFAPNQSLPPWGARLQATVEFCKQNIECRGTRRMRCSPFSRYKIWTPHPSCLTAIHLLPLEKAHGESGNLTATHKIHRFLKTGRAVAMFVQQTCHSAKLNMLAPLETNDYRNKRRAIRESPLR